MMLRVPQRTNMIACFYIDARDSGERERLEYLLTFNGFAFYDATGSDPYTREGSEFKTLEDIETDINMK
jgi:hypothetical protein